MQPLPAKRGTRGELAVIGLAIAVRVAVLCVFPQNLHDDRDSYATLAREVANGNGYVNGATGEPTAFRPPLYPLLLAALYRIDGNVAVGIAHVVLGALTTCFTMRIGRRLIPGSGALLAGMFVAVDPILVFYTTFPMTEGLCAFLTSLLLWSVSAARADAGNAPGAGAQLRTGILFGLCTLARPTYWLFGAVAALCWVAGRFRSIGVANPFPKWMIVGVALAVSPWVVRNMVALGHPVVMTTHGGYTLLLGNNPVYYAEEVARPWGTVWEQAPPERSQDAWYLQTLEQMQAEVGDDADEVEQDRWMSRRAIENIRNEPGWFARASLLRFTRFWSIIPMQPAREHVARAVWVGVGVFYTVVLLGFVIGLGVAMRNEPRRWLAIALLIASFSAAHLVYWSNARMRAPAIPGIALIAALGWGAVGGSLRGSRDGRPEQFSGSRKV